MWGHGAAQAAAPRDGDPWRHGAASQHWRLCAARQPQHRHRCPAATVAGRMRPGAGRAAAWLGAQRDREAAIKVAGRGCFIGESVGGCGAPRAGDPGEEAEAEGSEPGAWLGRRGTVRGRGLGMQDSHQAAASLWPGWQEAAVPAKGAEGHEWDRRTSTSTRGCRGLPGVGRCLTDLSGGASHRKPCRSHSCSTSGSRSSWSPSCTGSCRRPAWGSLD